MEILSTLLPTQILHNSILQNSSKGIVLVGGIHLLDVLHVCALNVEMDYFRLA